jgi:hypothetical protein
MGENKIPVEVPTDALRDVLESAEKIRLAGKHSTTLQLPPDSVAALKQLREEMAKFEESRAAEVHKLADRFVRTSEIRMSFNERLILLAGGSFALSLTFLGSLHRAVAPNKPLASMGALEAAWLLLLLCIVCSWLHNLYYSAAVEQARGANASYVTANLVQRLSALLLRVAAIFKSAQTPSSELTDVMGEVASSLGTMFKQGFSAGTEMDKTTDRFCKVAAYLGAFAFLSILLAFCLLIIFAMKNAALL